MVKRTLLSTLILSILTLLCHAQISSKRLAPKDVTPVVIDNIKYSAPTNQMGYVVAKDASADTVIWRKQIYARRYANGLEKDVQDIFIDSLYIKGKNLMIHTERGKVYSLQVK